MVICLRISMYEIQFYHLPIYVSTGYRHNRWSIRPDLSGQRGIIMLFYSHLKISREQHDWQIPFLATRARQPLGKKYHSKK